VENGQFAQLEPGVGRLLGVLSLQALPRRITLDFRDVFSQGFAFDQVSGSIQMKKGVLRHRRPRTLRPGGRLHERRGRCGEESQNLRVKSSRPCPSRSPSVPPSPPPGAIHPMVGVAAYLVQKALRDPVEKLFSFEYAVTGNWSDPKVEKLAAVPVAAPTNSPSARRPHEHPQLAASPPCR
jgi:uncharacterized protein YhdP